MLAAAESGARVAAVGCLAERYGTDLADELPEAQVLSFDDYSDISARLDDVLAGHKRDAHVARDRRTLLPVTPASRQQARAAQAQAVQAQAGHAPVALVSESGVDLSDLPPGVAPASGPPVVRRRLTGGVTAPLKIASGCDRRCSFCAIPSFRGSFVSRLPDEILGEASHGGDPGARVRGREQLVDGLLLGCLDEAARVHEDDVGVLSLAPQRPAAGRQTGGKLF